MCHLCGGLVWLGLHYKVRVGGSSIRLHGGVMFSKLDFIVFSDYDVVFFLSNFLMLIVILGPLTAFPWPWIVRALRRKLCGRKRTSVECIVDHAFI